MKPSKIIITAGSLVAGVALAQVAPGPFEPNVESLKAHYEFPEWFRDAKLGIYTHWGPVTHAIQHPDETNVGRFGWYGKQIYTPGSGGFKYHEKYWGGSVKTGYKDICKLFKAEDFDADKWAEIFEMAGARFAGPVSVHHDNFLMWDSNLNPWCASKVGPKRDICGEVAAAVRKRGMKFIGTFHHGFTYRYYEGAWNYDGKEAPELYGPERSPIPKMVEQDGKQIKNPEWQKIPREWQEYWRDSVDEFVTRYQPDLIWFDFGLGWQDDDIRFQMYANYYNKAIAWGQKHPTVACKQRGGDTVFHGTLDLERGNMPMLTAYPWLSDTSASAWFYYPNPSMQSDDSLVDMFVDIVAKNGCMLLNIGPDHKGNIPAEFMSGLKALGAFNDLNGEGIFETRPWLTYGEGVTKTSSGHHRAANSLAHEGSNFTSDDIRYTQSKDGKTLYAFIMDWPDKSELTLKSVHVDQASTGAGIELLGHGKIEHRINDDKSITVTLPAKAPNPHCNGLKLTGLTCSWQPLGHYLLANAARIDPGTAKTAKGKLEIDFQYGSIGHASILLGSKTAAKGAIEILDGGKRVTLVDFDIEAGETLELGDFTTRGAQKGAPKPARMVISGLQQEDITALAVGPQRGHTILQLDQPFH